MECVISLCSWFCARIFWCPEILTAEGNYSKTYTPWNWQLAPEIGHSKRKLVYQPSIFRFEKVSSRDFKTNNAAIQNPFFENISGTNPAPTKGMGPIWKNPPISPRKGKPTKTTALRRKYQVSLALKRSKKHCLDNTSTRWGRILTGWFEPDFSVPLKATPEFPSDKRLSQFVFFRILSQGRPNPTNQTGRQQCQQSTNWYVQLELLGMM